MHCKSYSHFFSKKFQHICVSLDVNFNESLINDVVSFEQLGPEVQTYREHFYLMTARAQLFKTNDIVSEHIVKTLIIKYGIHANIFAEKM